MHDGKFATCGAELNFVNYWELEFSHTSTGSVGSGHAWARSRFQAGTFCKGNGMRVLLIEDDSATAQSIELMLKSESFNVYTTDLGEEGVDLGKLYDYDIILLDLNLPDMSGYEVLRTLRVAKVQTPILILSGLAGIEDSVVVSRALGAHIADVTLHFAQDRALPLDQDALQRVVTGRRRRRDGHPADR